MNMKAKKTTQPFKVPQGYLEGFKVRFPKANKNTPFKVPEGYFTAFNIQLPTPEKHAQKVTPLYKKATYWAAAAAILLLIATPLLLSKNTELHANTPIGIAAIDQYWDYATDAITPYDMATFVTTNPEQYLTENTLSVALDPYLESKLHPLEALNINRDEDK